jgi:hypothetical protein
MREGIPPKRMFLILWIISTFQQASSYDGGLFHSGHGVFGSNIAACMRTRSCALYVLSLFENEHVLGLQTTAYIQHHSAGPGAMLEVSDLMSTDSRSSDQAAVISVMIVRRVCYIYWGMPLTSLSRISCIGSYRYSPLAGILSNSQ